MNRRNFLGGMGIIFAGAISGNKFFVAKVKNIGRNTFMRDEIDKVINPLDVEININSVIYGGIMNSKISNSILLVFIILLLLLIGITPFSVAQTTFDKLISQDTYPPQTAYLKTSSLKITNNLSESSAADK